MSGVIQPLNNTTSTVPDQVIAEDERGVHFNCIMAFIGQQERNRYLLDEIDDLKRRLANLEYTRASCSVCSSEK